MTLTVFLLLLSAALLHAVWNTLLKMHGDRLVVMAMITASSGFLGLLALPFVRFPAAEAWPYLWLSLLLHQGYYLFLLLAYRHGELSHVYPLARGSAPLFVAIMSVIFVGEVLTRQATLSVVIIAVGIMSLALTKGSMGIREPKAVIFALATGLFIASYTVADGLGARSAGSPHGYNFWLLALDGIPLATFALFVRGKKALHEVRANWKPGLVAGIVSAVAIWIVIWAFTVAPLAQVSALRETSIVFAVLFGVVFLKEKLDLVRLVAIASTLLGTVMLKTSR